MSYCCCGKKHANFFIGPSHSSFFFPYFYGCCKHLTCMLVPHPIKAKACSQPWGVLSPRCLPHLVYMTGGFPPRFLPDLAQRKPWSARFACLQVRPHKPPLQRCITFFLLFHLSFLFSHSCCSIPLVLLPLLPFIANGMCGQPHYVSSYYNVSSPGSARFWYIMYLLCFSNVRSCACRYKTFSISIVFCVYAIHSLIAIPLPFQSFQYCCSLLTRLIAFKPSAYLSRKKDGVNQTHRLFYHIKRFSYNSSTSLSHACADASLGIRQSPRGERQILPTFTPSGMQLRLNCCEKKRR